MASRVIGYIWCHSCHYYVCQRRRLCSLRSVCLSVRRITQKVVNGFWQISWTGSAWPRDQGDKFWWRSGSPSGSRSPKSKIRIHWIIEKVRSGRRSKLHS